MSKTEDKEKGAANSANASSIKRSLGPVSTLASRMVKQVAVMDDIRRNFADMAESIINTRLKAADTSIHFTTDELKQICLCTAAAHNEHPPIQTAVGDIRWVPGVVGVTGASGSGKSTFAREFAECARQAGHSVDFTAVSEPTSMLDFGMWSFCQLLDDKLESSRDVLIVDSLKDLLVDPVITASFQMGRSGLSYGVGSFLGKLNRIAMKHKKMLLCVINPWIADSGLVDTMVEGQCAGIVQITQYKVTFVSSRFPVCREKNPGDDDSSIFSEARERFGRESQKSKSAIDADSGLYFPDEIMKGVANYE